MTTNMNNTVKSSRKQPVSIEQITACEAIVAQAKKNAKLLNGQLIVSIPVKYLAVDHEYQREIAGSRWSKVLDIASRYNSAKAGVILVSYRKSDGAFYIIDGQGRYEAAMKASLSAVNCQILMNCTQRNEAELFMSQDENVTKVSTHAKVKAGIVAQHDDCMKLNEIMNKYGVLNSRQISSIGAALSIVEEDPEALDWVFSIIYRAGWNEMKNGFSQFVIKALYTMYEREVLGYYPGCAKQEQNEEVGRKIQTVLIPIMRENSPTVFSSVASLYCNSAKTKYLNVYTIFSGIVANGNREFLLKLHNMQVKIPEKVLAAK